MNRVRACWRLCCYLIAAASCVPAFAGTAQLERHYVYATARGDTLVALADRFLLKRGDWQLLQKINGIARPDRIPVGTQVRIPVSAMRADPATATVIAARGKVDVDGQSGIVGAAVKEGATVRTGDDGMVAIKLADGSTITVQSKSAVRLETARQFANTGGVTDSVVRLDAGRIETAVARQKGSASRYEIRTPTSNMGVRGTIFRAAADADGKREQSEVIEGLVGIASTTAAAAGPIALAAGFGSIVAAGKAPSPPIALLPAPEVSAKVSAFQVPNPSMVFSAVKGAVAYRSQVATDESFTGLVADVLTTKAEANFSDLPDGTLFFRARGVDAQGLEGMDASIKISVRARPIPPVLASPSPAAVESGATLQFKWQPAVDAHTYRLQLAKSSDVEFASPIDDKSSLQRPSLDPALPLPAGEYRWRVASVDVNGRQGPWTAPGMFRILVQRPTLTALRDARIASIRIHHAGSAGFQVQLSRNQHFTEVFSEQMVTGERVTLEGLPVQVYFVRARAMAKAGDGNLSPVSEWSEASMLEVFPFGWWLTGR